MWIRFIFVKLFKVLERIGSWGANPPLPHPPKIFFPVYSFFPSFQSMERLPISKDLKQTKKFWICCYGNWLLGFKCKIVLFHRPKNMDKKISYVSDFCASISRGGWSVFWMKWFFWWISLGHVGHGHTSTIKKIHFFVFEVWKKKFLSLNENLAHLKHTSYWYK